MASVVLVQVPAASGEMSMLSIRAEIQTDVGNWDIQKDRIHQEKPPGEFKVMMDCWMKISKTDDNVHHNFWITAGTLLGQTRDKAFLGWDHDMDFAFANDHYRDFWNIMTAGLKEEHHREASGDTEPTCKGISFRQHYYRAAQAWGFKASLKNYDGTWIADFFPVMSSKDNNGDESMTQFAGTVKRTKAIYTVPADSVFPTRDCIISDLPSRCPSKAASILNARYGVDKWKVSPYDHYDHEKGVWIKRMTVNNVTAGGNGAVSGGSPMVSLKNAVLTNTRPSVHHRRRHHRHKHKAQNLRSKLHATRRNAP